MDPGLAGHPPSHSFSDCSLATHTPDGAREPLLVFRKISLYGETDKSTQSYQTARSFLIAHDQVRATYPIPVGPLTPATPSMPAGSGCNPSSSPFSPCMSSQQRKVDSSSSLSIIQARYQIAFQTGLPYTPWTLPLRWPRLAERTLGKSRRRTAYPQQIVTTRLLYCLQDRFAQLSRLQRI
jgi:hypothetical protein